MAELTLTDGGGDQARRVEAGWLASAAARQVAAALAAGGAEALFVGGCVRNALIGAAVADLDMATDAPPAEVQALLEAAGIRHVPTGIEHGTVTALVDGRGVEITTFRKDVETDGRRAVVAFGGTLEEDAARRDFTLNALYARPDGEVLDPLGHGLADLEARRIRFIGDPAARIEEDRLRILRFYRFHALYGEAQRGLDAAGQAACAAAAAGVEALARERIGAEIRKLLAAPDPGPALAAMAEAGVLARTLPSASLDALGRLAAAEALSGAAPDWKRRLVAMGVAPDDAAERLRLSRADLRALRSILAAKEEERPPGQNAYRHGAEAARDAALLTAAAAGAPPPKALQREVAKGATQEFPVSAEDLVARGMKPGKALGARLAKLEEAWLDSNFRLTRGEMLDG
ncbi:MAG: CCA tRNA nucleotidyltransferase [Pseudomonadota bacterium]